MQNLDTDFLITRTLELRAKNPSLGHRRIAQEISVPGWDYNKVRRTIEHAERKRLAVPILMPVVEPRTAEEFAERIAASWRSSVEAIIEVGRLLAAAKAQLEHGEFESMITQRLPFGRRTAQRLMAVGRDERITNATHVSHLPPSWGTLYELTKLDDAQFEAKISDGTIRPEMQRQDIVGAVKTTNRASRERILGGIQCALPAVKYGVIVADPEWRFEPWSRSTGMDRAADNHYPTSATEVIASRDVPSIAADDCVLFLWATVPMLPHALLVMGAWGFDYKSHIVWFKTRPSGVPAIGTGYWFRNCHELLLVGTRGKIPAPSPGTQEISCFEALIGPHSQKPDEFLRIIEEYFPTLPKIELNRRGPARDGWHAWGNESGQSLNKDQNCSGTSPQRGSPDAAEAAQ
jgi:N6-adenosine-specific RNA methylase IME4